MSLNNYLRVLLYGSALAAIGAAWFISSTDPTAGHGQLMQQIRDRNVELQRQIDEL